MLINPDRRYAGWAGPVLFLALGWAIVTAPAAMPGNETMAFLEQRVKDDPLDFVAQNRLSTVAINQMRETGDLDFLAVALASARASLAAVPAAQNAGGLSVLAVAEFESHHFQEALALAQQAYAIDPRNTGALATMGDAKLELGDYTEAGKIYGQLEHGDTPPSLLARLARLAELTGDNAKAIELLTRCIGRHDNNAWYHVRLGEIYFRTGDLAKAEEQYAAGRQLRPDSYLVLEHLAELRAAQGNFPEATTLYRQVIARVPRGEFLQALGELYAFMGRPADAAPWYERALSAYLESVAQGNAHYYHHLAGFYSDVQENPAEALRWARQDLAARHSIYAIDSLAWALYKNGEYSRAAEEMTRALAYRTQDAHLLFHAGMIFSRAGELARGRALLAQSLSVNPRYNSFHVHR